MLKQWLLILALMAGLVPVGQADISREQAQHLTEEGEILPLAQVLAELRQQYPGHAIEVELEREHGRYIYEIEWLDPEGRVWEFKIDARNGELLERERDD